MFRIKGRKVLAFGAAADAASFMGEARVRVVEKGERR